jgi:hypothetical protein
LVRLTPHDLAPFGRIPLFRNDVSSCGKYLYKGLNTRFFNPKLTIDVNISNINRKLDALVRWIIIHNMTNTSYKTGDILAKVGITLLGFLENMLLVIIWY